MATALKQVIEMLGELSAEDRAEVVRWCEALGAQSKGLADNEPAIHAFEEFALQLAEHYQAPPVGLNWYIRNRGNHYRQLLRATDRAWQLVGNWWPGSRKNTRLALLRYICRLVFQVTARRHRRLNWQHLITALADAEVAINDAFPGWLSDGLFQSRVLAQVAHNKTTLLPTPHMDKANVRPKPDPRAGLA